MIEQPRILVIQDSQADFETIDRYLKQHGVPARCSRIESLEELRHAMDVAEWDVVLFDYGNPRLNFPECLSRIQSRMPEAPVILLSDRVNEEQEIELLKQGVWDLVDRHNPARLAPAIQRGLRNAALLRSRLESERALRKNEQRLNLALAASGMGVWEWDLRTDAVYCSPESLRITGTTDFSGTIESFAKALHPADRDRVMSTARQALVDRAVCELEFRIIRPDGEVRWVSSLGRAEYDGQGNPLRLIGTMQDSTERKRGEDELRSSVAMWNNTFDAMSDAICIMDVTGRILRNNRAMLQLVDKYPQEIVNRRCWEVVHDSDSCISDCPFQKMLASRRRESSMVLRLGRWLNIIADPIIDQAGKITGAVHIITDVTERKQVEEKLRESESKFRSLSEQSLAGTYIIQDNTFKYVNPRFAEMFGYHPEEIVQRKGPQDLVTPEDRRGAAPLSGKKPADQMQTLHYEFRGVKKNGDALNAEVFGSASTYRGRPAIIGIMLDITEKKKLEEQLRQAQKMEAVGQLTGGIAHDFNNMLSAIIGYASLLQMRIKADDSNRRFVDQILVGTDRAANLIRSLLTFSRKQLTSTGPIDINESIRRVEKLYQRIIGEDISLRTAPAPGRLIVNADPGQIEQVLMNLVVNAGDAMQHGGTLSIETSLAEYNGAGEAAKEAGKANHVLISVSDTGIGMDEKTREKIFEPFFTTKDAGRGTGLGLSMVYGIIKQHNGYIHCYSEPGMGTTFKIYLPLLTATGDAEKGAPGVPAVVEQPLGGTETVLLAEDDEALRSLARVTLQDFGYTVIDAVNGKDAVEQFQQNKDAIHLVLCDVIMPVKNGAEVQKEIRKEAPGTRILFMSGYPADIMHKKSLLEEDAEIILKPFSPTALLKKIREVLDRTDTGSRSVKPTG